MDNQTNKASMTAPRERKYQKIITILKDFLGQDLSDFNCLDIGCSDGGITNNLADHFQTTIGIDIDHSAVSRARKNRKYSSTYYLIASGNRIPFNTNDFDIVVCAQVYEHTKDQVSLSKEIWRILRPGGICFFSGPNRLAIMEEHYWLPFLSWFPRPIGNYYLKLFQKRDEYDVYPLLYWQIRKLWQQFIIFDYTNQMITNPERFSVENRVAKYPWITRISPQFVKLLAPLYPNYNWILQKPIDSSKMTSNKLN